MKNEQTLSSRKAPVLDPEKALELQGRPDWKSLEAALHAAKENYKARQKVERAVSQARLTIEAAQIVASWPLEWNSTIARARRSILQEHIAVLEERIRILRKNFVYFSDFSGIKFVAEAQGALEKAMRAYSHEALIFASRR